MTTYQAILTDINQNKFPSEEYISVLSVSKRYSKGLSPVRDALKELTHNKILIKGQGRRVLLPKLTTSTSSSLHFLLKSLIPKTTKDSSNENYESWKLDIFSKFPLYKGRKENTEVYDCLVNQHNLYKWLLGTSKCALSEILLETFSRLFRYQYFALLHGEDVLLSRDDYHILLDFVIDDDINGLIGQILNHIDNSENAVNRAILENA